ncbi:MULTISPECIES: hypothetical protein [unclassified Bacteroides]|uniref:hypothetical protein n=1 Tax=unclassified Bacteroides TaxID=2646097 RepID=UPI0004E1876E|nr:MULTISPECIES: hypothetical protein [unclassified Bacteroides]
MTEKNKETKDISLEYIQQEKERVKALLDKSQERLKDISQKLISPPKPKDKREQVAALVGNAFTIFDGVMIGIKVTQHLRSLFGKNRG